MSGARTLGLNSSVGGLEDSEMGQFRVDVVWNVQTFWLKLLKVLFGRPHLLRRLPWYAHLHNCCM